MRGSKTESFTISLSFSEPRWVSMVALYFNCYDEANVTRHFDIYATDLESKKDLLVASIRGNRQLFRLVKFPPVKTPMLRIELVNSIRRLRTITEIELYGPLTCKEGKIGFADAEGQNTWMGDFSRVDKRRKLLAAEFAPPVVKARAAAEGETWAVPAAQIMVSEGACYITRTLGYSETCSLDDLAKPRSVNKGTHLAVNPYVALYGGLLLKCSTFGKLVCCDAESGREIWSAQLGDRLFGGPVAIAEDVFIASDTGKLFKLDLANGSVMMEVALSAGVFGSLATDGRFLFMITADGFLQCYDSTSGGKVWAVPVAADTDSTPAVDGGIVYSADQKGTARACAAGDGKTVWSAELGQEFTRCPVVIPSHVIFGCRDGKLAALNRPNGQLPGSFRIRSDSFRHVRGEGADAGRGDRFQCVIT